MEEKYWYGISFCYPEANLTPLAKYAFKVALTFSGTPAAGLVSEGLILVFKPLYGGIPIACKLTIADNYFEFRPDNLATYFAEGVEKFQVPGGDIVSVEKSLNLLIMQHVIKIQLKNTEMKFFVTAYSVSAGEIVRNLRKLIK